MYLFNPTSTFIPSVPFSCRTRWRGGRSPTCSLRDDFPILSQSVHGHPLIYLDSAATSQKPQVVIDAMEEFYRSQNGPVHRGVCAYELAARAGKVLEQGREDVARFIGADPKEIVFTRNATEGINLVAYAWAMHYLEKGDEIVLSVMEHHSNVVPWQLVARKTGAVLKVVKMDEKGGYDFEGLARMISGKTRLITLAHVSNVLGCINPVKDVCELARAIGAKVLIDACQSVPHRPVNIRDIRCDWLVASGHKMFATGVGFLYVGSRVMDQMAPFMGGDGILTDYPDGDQNLDRYLEPGLFKFEAGALPLAGIAGLSAAIRYMEKIGMDNVSKREQHLAQYLRSRLNEFDEITVYGPPAGEPRAALCAFNVKGVHPTDLATMIDLEGIAIRSGHHCAQPLHRELGVESSARASLHIYNTTDEIDRFIDVLKETVALLGGSLTRKQTPAVAA